MTSGILLAGAACVLLLQGPKEEATETEERTLPLKGYLDGEFDSQKVKLEEKHLEEAIKRNQEIKQRVKKVCEKHSKDRRLWSRKVASANGFLVDMDHKLGFCRHGKVHLNNKVGMNMYIDGLRAYFPSHSKSFKYVSECNQSLK